LLPNGLNAVENTSGPDQSEKVLAGPSQRDKDPRKLETSATGWDAAQGPG